MVTDRTALLAVARAVPDPELPVLSLGDLGVIRDLRLADDGSVEVDLTPTYTGCPALAVIADDVRDALRGSGADQVRVRTVLAPAWATGPGGAIPYTREVSHFGSTPCKALWTCRSCAEPFDSFKAL